MNAGHPHAGLIAAFSRAEADAAHKLGLIKAAANKGPRAIQAAMDTADKAAKRRHAFAKKLQLLGPGEATPETPPRSAPAPVTAT